MTSTLVRNESEMSAPPSPDSDRGSWWPRWRPVVLGVAIVVVALAWWWASTVRLDRGTSGGFSSDTATVVRFGFPIGQDMNVLIQEPGATAVLGTSLKNHGPVGVRIDNLSLGPDCMMKVADARVHTGPDIVDVRPGEPALGATIPAGEQVQVYMDLVMPERLCRMEGLSPVGHVTVTATALGRDQQVRVPLGDIFMQSSLSADDVRGFVDVRVDRPN